MKESTSKRWLSGKTRQVLLRRALVKTMGYTDEDLDKPIVGIINTWAETNPGHYHFRQLAEAVKRGVWAAGGFPLEVNTMSICEVFFDISSLIFRNLLSMTTEELIERHPFDGVVLMGSCDKNVPAQLMAAVSANKPAIYLPGGPMLPGNYRGESLACGTDSFKLWTKYLAGELKEEDLSNVEGCLYGSVGACPIMGTANSMQCATESLGLSLPGSAAAPAVSAEKFRIAEMTGDISKSEGWLDFIVFMALLSINLGLINLFPIPVLDGGSVVIYVLEIISGREMNDRVKEYLFRFGLSLLAALMIFATWNDVVHLFDRWFNT